MIDIEELEQWDRIMFPFQGKQYRITISGVPSYEYLVSYYRMLDGEFLHSIEFLTYDAAVTFARSIEQRLKDVK